MSAAIAEEPHEDRNAGNRLDGIAEQAAIGGAESDREDSALRPAEGRVRRRAIARPSCYSARAARRAGTRRNRSPRPAPSPRPARGRARAGAREGVEGMDLPRIEPVHVEEESPAHRRWPRPYQPCRAEHDENPAIWHRKFTVRTRKLDGGCAAATTTCRAGARVRCGEIERDRLPRQQIFDAAEHGDAVSAFFELAQAAAHHFKIEPVSGPDACAPRRRGPLPCGKARSRRRSRRCRRRKDRASRAAGRP